MFQIKRRLKGISTVAFLLVLGATLYPASLSAEPAGVWIAGDFHNHTVLTDGSQTLEAVLDHGLNRFGLTWIINSEHGGASARNLEGRPWSDPAIQPPVVFKGDEKLDREKRRVMWRWQCLSEVSFPAILEARQNPKYAGKVILQGLEFNCPGHEHVSTGILADSGLPLAEFEYRFDASDTDTSGGPDGKWQGKNHTNDHAKALQAIAWLDKHYRGRSWFIVNHPERANRYRIEDLRDFNNTAPQVAFGFEGAPGHHKYKHRGGYGERSFTYADNGQGGATYGSAGVFLARVGGVWDALLAEGRRFFAFANSDFHHPDPDRDFWPGEYQKTYVYVTGPVTGEAILEAMREGRSFFVTGDLIDAMEFTVSAGGRSAAMGGVLQTQPGSDVTVTIRLHDPRGKNALGDEVELNRVDLIGGDVTGPVPKYLEDGKTENPAYKVDTNPSARVLAHFDSSNWKVTGDGWVEMTYTLPKLDRNVYLRLRGTNLPRGTEYESDAEGNPLNDNLAEKRGLDGLDEARAEQWFYSNPVFVRVR